MSREHNPILYGPQGRIDVSRLPKKPTLPQALGAIVYMNELARGTTDWRVVARAHAAIQAAYELVILPLST